MGFCEFSGLDVSSTAPITAWQNGCFRAARAGRRKLLFGCMYEDAAIELRVFQPGGRIFCIASAGCTAMKLAAHHTVVAVDINPVQVAYVQERLGGAARFSVAAPNAFSPLRAPSGLSQDGTDEGWEHSSISTIRKEQILYWRRHLDTRRFRAAFSFLFSRLVLRSVYSAAFLNGLPPNFGTVLRTRMERCFALHPNRRNPYAHALLLGDMHSAPDAPELRQIQLRCADAADFLERQPAGSFTGFSLSNILDGANPVYAQRLIAAVQHAAAPGAMVVLRSFREPQCATETNHAAEDRAMLWGVVDVRQASAL